MFYDYQRGSGKRPYLKYQRGGLLYTPIGTLSRQLSTYAYKNKRHVGKYSHNQMGSGIIGILADILL